MIQFAALGLLLVIFGLVVFHVMAKLRKSHEEAKDQAFDLQDTKTELQETDHQVGGDQGRPGVFEDPGGKHPFHVE